MRRKILIIFLIFLAAIAEISLFPNFFPRRIAPDAVLILIVIWSKRKNFQGLWFWAVVSGLVVDIFSFSRIGASAVSFLLISFAVSFLSWRFFSARKGHSFLPVALFVAGGILANYVMVNFLNSSADYFSGTGGEFWKNFSFQIWLFKLLGGLILCAIIYYPVISLKSVFPAEENNLIVN